MNKHMLTTWLISAGVFLFSLSAQAIELGKPLPLVKVEDRGLMQLSGDSINYKPFSSNQLNGKVTTILVVAARMGMDDVNKLFTDAMAEAGLSKDHHRFVSVVDVDQALFGTGGLVMDRVETRQREHPGTSFVLDDEGIVIKTWDLKEKGSAVTIIDANGTVIRHKDGALNEIEVKDFLSALKAAGAFGDQ